MEKPCKMEFAVGCACAENHKSQREEEEGEEGKSI